MSKINWKETVHYLFMAVSIAGFLLMLGTVGGMTNDSIDFGKGVVQCVIGLAMWVGGMLVYDN